MKLAVDQQWEYWRTIFFSAANINLPRVLLGFRVPTVIVSPFTRGSALVPRVASILFDHTSVLKLIEWRWNLPPLTARDASSEIGSLAATLDFTQQPATAPQLPAPVQSPLPSLCSGNT